MKSQKLFFVIYQYTYDYKLTSEIEATIAILKEHLKDTPDRIVESIFKKSFQSLVRNKGDKELFLEDMKFELKDLKGLSGLNDILNIFSDYTADEVALECNSIKQAKIELQELIKKEQCFVENNIKTKKELRSFVKSIYAYEKMMSASVTSKLIEEKRLILKKKEIIKKLKNNVLSLIVKKAKENFPELSYSYCYSRQYHLIFKGQDKEKRPEHAICDHNKKTYGQNFNPHLNHVVIVDCKACINKAISLVKL